VARGWLADITLETVLVHVEGAPSMKGLKSAVHDDCLVLREVLVLHEDDAAEQLGGLVVIPRERVMFIQVVS
jgi:hypothetical protein